MKNFRNGARFRVHSYTKRYSSTLSIDDNQIAISLQRIPQKGRHTHTHKYGLPSAYISYPPSREVSIYEEGKKGI